MEVVKAIILGIIQGITEWLPISSTGHLILVEDFLQFNLSESFIRAFYAVVHLGTVLAVIVLFFNQLNPINKTKKEKQDIVSLWIKIIIATLPAAIIGYLFSDKIDKYLYNSTTVSLMLIIYGIVFIIIEKKTRYPKVANVAGVPYRFALGMGIFQVLALIPGTSRSGATIIGAIVLGTSRLTASEFSFFLAIPTILGANVLKLSELALNLTLFEWQVLIIGSLTAFIVSMYSIRFLLNYIKNHSFKMFGYYRIILGLIILIYFGIKLIF